MLTGTLPCRQDDEAELLGAALQLSLADEVARQQRAARKAAASPLRGRDAPRREAFIPQSMAAMSAECALCTPVLLPAPAPRARQWRALCRNLCSSPAMAL